MASENGPDSSLPKELSTVVSERLIRLASRLVDQERAQVLIEPLKSASGFWFGGGNMILDRSGGFGISGRYRNAGDSRTGLRAGERGLECALFRSESFNGPFEKVRSWSKADLGAGRARVLSIEGTALRASAGGLELYISMERDLSYPEGVARYQKPGTGVWSIDLLRGSDIASLATTSQENILASCRPVSLHVKDPVVVDDGRGETQLFYCEHPFNWSCSYTGLAVRAETAGGFQVRNDYVLPRGHVWDVAAARITDRLHIPQLGVLADLPPLSLYFYDGAECVREHEQNAKAVSRPRGYSCEEIGGLAWGWDAAFPAMQRLSVLEPLFVSPMGTGCSRYVSTLSTRDGLYASWQQSQQDCSQPLVGHALPLDEVERILK